MDVETSPALPSTRAPRSQATTPLVLAFTATTFLSATLLFSIQPLFAKMVLPVLGGAPSVWAMAVCFFQIALLVGYCYAHLVKTYVPARLAGPLHVAVCLLAFLSLPIALPAQWGAPPPGEPYLWQFGLFTVAVGLPFVAVAANAPLLQAWFAGTTHPAARDPYFLYAASNLGSFIALLGYPFALEPALGLTALSRFWTLGFALLVLCLAAVFYLARRDAAPVASPHGSSASAADAAAPPLWSTRARWVFLSLVPSALLTAFTTHVTTDVASAPLLWVMPLSMYLLTFVLVFRDRALVPRHILLPLHLVAVTFALLVLSQTTFEGWYLTAPVGALAFFVSAMVAHRTLYESRPPASRLTEFYLWMSLGGALGGLAAALVAPKIFSEVYEYPLLLALTFACRPGAFSLGRDWRNGSLGLWLVAAVAGLAVFWIPWALPHLPNAELLAKVTDWGAAALAAAVLAATLVLNWRHPARQLVAALGMCLAVTLLPSAVRKGTAQRSYFGVYRVMQSADGEWNTLVHGSTLHGAQRIRDENGEPVADITPATYYYEASPMARTVATRRAALAAQGKTGRYGVIGLGTGTMACHAKEGETWRIFEIDPVMIKIASGDENFTYLENCLPHADIQLGDARLTLAKEQDASFDLLVVDAFSSDAVPVHLMTAEAMQLYLRKLTPDGIALLHISNRYLDLDSVLGATTTAVPGIHGFILSDDNADGSYAQSTSSVGLFAKSAAALVAYKELADLKPLDATKLRPWTDDYSDILRPIILKYRRRFTVEPDAAAEGAK